MSIDIAGIVLSLILVANAVFAIVIVFVDRKRPHEMLAWLLLFTFLPVVGFLLFMLFGQKLFMRRRSQMVRREEYHNLLRILHDRIGYLEQATRDRRPNVHPNEGGLLQLNALRADAPVTFGNQVTLFKHGTEKFESLFQDIAAAEESIHMEYFIWRANGLGVRLVEALTEKARQGVQVRLILDDWGCKLTPPSLFRPLAAAGGSIHRFLPVNLAWSFNANYRNHRKLVVIDGRIGYLGGMNVGDEYLGLRPGASPWRDTHVRIVGPAVWSLQARFLLDHLFVTGKHIPIEESWLPSVDDSAVGEGRTEMSAVQIVSSGPDSEEQQIRNAFLKMISMANESLYVQTPYLVPDESVLQGLKLAAYSGVDVRVMIPGVCNNPVVHRVTMAYAGELLGAGVKIYQYQGFLHSKVLLCDRSVLTVGTTNMDVRSFALNFEVNAFIYDRAKAEEFAEMFQKDMEDSVELTPERYRGRGHRERFLESVFRLFAPLM